MKYQMQKNNNYSIFYRDEKYGVINKKGEIVGRTNIYKCSNS